MKKKKKLPWQHKYGNIKNVKPDCPYKTTCEHCGYYDVEKHDCIVGFKQ